MIMLMTEDKPPQTEQVHLSGVNPEIWALAQGGPVKGASLAIVHLKPGHTQPNRKQYSLPGGPLEHFPCDTDPK